MKNLHSLFQMIAFIPLVSLADTSIDSVSIDKYLHVMRVTSDKGNTTSVALIKDGSTLLIDPNFNKTSDLIKTKLAQLGSNRVTHITSTHEHMDHIEQYPEFNAHAQVIVPINQIKSIDKLGVNFDIAFTGELVLKIADQPVKLQTLPNMSGHTGGDQVVYFSKQNTLYVGDYLFAKGYPIIDQRTGDLAGYLNNIVYLTQNYPANTLVIPGHSSFAPDPVKLFTISDLLQFAERLSSTVTFIKEQKNRGQDLETIVKKGLPTEFRDLNKGMKFVSEERWIKYVFGSLM
ncbi:MBL fold metallo-hydrolase [uncultured Paraglaciecola sp.]|uniref:MBL fold metallo-hydrolase n=1 Tax=uncultured Paraglaciecola sp. TaxID=1765024 RepID=UPI0026396ECD|nr:MBL fold metallo-hydrolase [uncultured Paraglaciecola sp.]